MLRLFRPAYTLMWYVLREFFVAFALTLMAMTIFWLLLVSFTMAAELENFGADATQVLMLAPFILPRALTLSLPPATMIATIMVFGRLSAESEILAAQAGGAALRRFVWPLLICSIVISMCSLWLHDTGMRWGNDTIRTQVLKLNKPESFIKTLDKPGGNMSIHPDANKYTRINMLPSYRDMDGNEMRPVEIIDFQNNKIMQTVLAEHHQFNADPAKGASDRKLSISLTNVQTYSDNFNRASEISLSIPLPDIGALIPIGNTRGQKSWRENLDEGRKIARDEHRRWSFLLRRAADFGSLAAASAPLDAAAPAFVSNSWNDSKLGIEAIIGQGGALDRMRQDNIEFHRKIALSILPFSMIFLGVGLGLLVKKSNRMIGFLLGLALYALLYYPLTIVAKSLSSTGNWDKMAKVCPPQYLPNILFLLLGYFLWRMHEHGFPINFSALLRVKYTDDATPDSSEPGGIDATREARRRQARSVDGGVPDPFEGVGNVTETVPIKHKKSLLSQIIEIPLMALAYTLHFIFVVVIWNILRAAFWLVTSIILLPIRIFRRTTDVYIGSSFLTPLFIVILCIAGLVTAFDVIEHLSEIVDGIRHSMEPMGALPVRTQPEAIRDVIVLYGIQALDFTLEYLPLWVLIAGMLCAMVLVRNQEHLILKSSGIRLQRALRPAIILAIMACASVTVVREMWMPELILHRDFLKPQVYHRNSQPSSLALHILDENKKPMLVEMGSYNFATRQGKDLHVYLLGEQKNGRIPQLTADVVRWDSERQGWNLFTDPSAKPLVSPGLFGGSKDKTTEKEKADKAKKNVPEAPTELVPGGQRRDMDNGIDPKNIGSMNGATMPAMATHITRVDFWKGPINPKYIDSERLGAKVMRLNELKRNSEYKPELMVEWYKRVSEFAMGFILLWCALPLMLSDSAHSPVTSIAFGTLLAAVYWCLCMASAKLGVDATSFTLFAHTLKIPVWAPLIPHGIFFIVGFIQFYFRLET